MSYSSAARTNLTSDRVRLHRNEVVGVGAFRTAYAGTYIGGNRNQQEAVCKCFKHNFRVLENEFFGHDFRVADKAIEYAEDWNGICEVGKEILVTRGDVHTIGGTKYLVEPLIRYFTKFTSNNGWIADEDDEGWSVLAMEAFSHYTYHRSGGSLIVCDIQGRYRHNSYNRSKCRFELTDPAICSRRRTYGPTDLGEKGIDSFFENHVQYATAFAEWMATGRGRGRRSSGSPCQPVHR
uniref:Alpha-type protein kinase domain-containing protein n=1 Tax=Pseudictyota dubia TaxID=2749911 RepID=A0A7R9WJI9_9STRA|mmetsp:Transcript_8134/g.14892  ORF Transcript_8134/g.14892 Transcript_8134/m.14892 type:complete len:237 (+) Transcript_8134:396-1106(+)